MAVPRKHSAAAAWEAVRQQPRVRAAIEQMKVGGNARLIAPARTAVVPPPAPSLPELPLPFTCTILGGPRTKKNSLRRRWGTATDGARMKFTIPSAAFEAWQKQVQPHLEEARTGFDPCRAPVNVRALIYREAAWRGDVAGYIQAIGDVLEDAGVLEDDYQIEAWDGTRRRLDRALPRVELLITRFADPNDDQEQR